MDADYQDDDPTKPQVQYQATDPGLPNYRPRPVQYQATDPGLPNYRPRRAVSESTNQPLEGPPGDPMTLPEVLRLAEHSATFGFGDEINAGARSLFTSQKYGDALTDEREKLRTAQGRPFANLPQIAGGVAPFLVTPALRAAGLLKAAASVPAELSTAGQIVNGVKGGLLYGGLSGAGNADVDPNASAKDILTGTALSAAKGAAVGGLFGGAVPVVAAGARGASHLLSDVLPGGSGRRATRMVLDDLLHSNPDLPAEQAKLQTAAAAGKPVVLGDVGGNGALGPLAAAAESTPGSKAGDMLRQAVGQRVIARPTRMASDVGLASSLPPVQMPQYAQGLRKEASATGNEMFAAARDESPMIAMTPDLERRVNTPTFKRGLRQATASLRPAVDAGEVQPLQSPFTTNADLLKKGEGLTPEFWAGLTAHNKAGGDPAAWAAQTVLRPEIDPSTLDAVVSQLGESSGAAARAGDKVMGKGFGSMKQQLLDPIRQYAPMFADARDQMAATQARARAADLGYKMGSRFSRIGAGDITAAVDGLNPDHVPDFRQGFAAAHRQQMSDAQINGILNPSKAGGIDPRLVAAYGDEGSGAYRDAVTQESAMRPFEESIQGSRTAPLALKQGQFAGPIGTLLKSAILRGSPGEGLAQAARVYFRPGGLLADKMAAATADKVGQTLLSSPEALDRFINLQARKRAMSGLLNIAGKSGANIIPNYLTPEQP